MPTYVAKNSEHTDISYTRKLVKFINLYKIICFFIYNTTKYYSFVSILTILLISLL